MKWETYSSMTSPKSVSFSTITNGFANLKFHPPVPERPCMYTYIYTYLQRNGYH